MMSAWRSSTAWSKPPDLWPYYRHTTDRNRPEPLISNIGASTTNQKVVGSNPAGLTSRKPTKSRLPGFFMSFRRFQKTSQNCPNFGATTDTLPTQKKDPRDLSQGSHVHPFASSSSAGGFFYDSGTSGSPAKDVSQLSRKATPEQLATLTKSISEKAAPTAIIETAVCAKVFTARIRAASAQAFQSRFIHLSSLMFIVIGDFCRDSAFYERKPPKCFS